MGTIKKMFPTLTTQDYYEIGKMCMDDAMPRNSETQMMSATIRWMKQNTPSVKYLYTWADGIVGKSRDMCIRQGTFSMVVSYGVTYMLQMSRKSTLSDYSEKDEERDESTRHKVWGYLDHQIQKWVSWVSVVYGVNSFDISIP